MLPSAIDFPSFYFISVENLSQILLFVLHRTDRFSLSLVYFNRCKIPPQTKRETTLKNIKAAIALVLTLCFYSQAEIRFIGPFQSPAPPPPPPSLAISCTAPTGDYGTGVPYGYFELRLFCTFTAPDANPINGSATFSYLTTKDIAANDLSMWMGTSNQPFETGTSITITTPDGRQAKYSHQFDKHTDVTGSFWRDKPGTYNIPAGSTITMVIVIGLPHGNTDCPGLCAVDNMWQFNHGLL